MKQLTTFGIGLIGVIIGAIFVGGRSDISANNALLPFQGHLTSATGAAIPDGARVVQFKIYDAPVSGDTVWAGEIHKLSVNKGLVNTLLGSKTALSGVDFSQPTYLEITIDANGDGQITAVDPPLLPRQVVVPALYSVHASNATYAAQADTMDGHGWEAILTEGDDNPTSGTLRSGIVGPDSISGSQISPGSIEFSDLFSRGVGNPANSPDIAASGHFSKVSTFPAGSNGRIREIPESEISIESTGGPVFVGMSGSSIRVVSANGDVSVFTCEIQLIRDGTEVVATTAVGHWDVIDTRWPVSFFVLDTPVAGTHTYEVRLRGSNNRYFQTTLGGSLVAFEF